jgi:hypothetical protein
VATHGQAAAGAPPMQVQHKQRGLALRAPPGGAGLREGQSCGLRRDRRPGRARWRAVPVEAITVPAAGLVGPFLRGIGGGFDDPTVTETIYESTFEKP